MSLEIDPSWNIIQNQVHLKPLKTLNTKILPNIKYYPEKNNIFRVFKKPITDIKVVILGHDPYPSPGDAIGLSFVNGTEKVPALLRIIKEELKAQGYTLPDIHTWEEQGVFLLNTALTVEAGNAGSHLKYWEDFTKTVIQYLSERQPTIWILWGKKAQSIVNNISKPYIITKEFSDYNYLPVDSGYNFILNSAHPAEEVYAGGKAGFYENDHFINVNKILKKKKLKEIIW